MRKKIKNYFIKLLLNKDTTSEELDIAQDIIDKVDEENKPDEILEPNCMVKFFIDGEGKLSIDCNFDYSQIEDFAFICHQINSGKMESMVLELVKQATAEKDRPEDYKNFLLLYSLCVAGDSQSENPLIRPSQVFAKNHKQSL